MQTGRHFLSSCSEVNSTGYPEFDEPISARHQRYPLFKYILISIIGSINFVIVFILSPVTLFIFVFLNFCNSYNRPLLKMYVVAYETSSNFFLFDYALSMDNACNRRLFSFPYKAEMAKEQE